MVILIRCNDIVSDPRAMKYVRYLQSNGIEHVLIGWTRDEKELNLPNSVLWRRKAGYNVGGLEAVKNRIGWMIFVLKQLFRLQDKDLILHGCDVDSAFPAACYKVFHKKAKLIFDVFDWFSATLFDQKPFVLRAFKIMEEFTVKKSDKIIICEPERIEQIPLKISNSKFTVLPNIPYFDSDSFIKRDKNKDFTNELITFSYVGGFTKDRCLFEIVEIAEKGFVNLAIAGYGDRDLEEKLLSLKGCPNIKYYGKVAYQDGLNISYNSDVMYAMYSKISPNNIYAAPNKYYESMFLGKPLFSTKGTLVEKKLLLNNMGFVSEEGIDEIQNTILSITNESIDEYGKNAHKLWENKYSHYTSDWLNNEYLKFLQE